MARPTKSKPRARAAAGGFQQPGTPGKDDRPMSNRVTLAQLREICAEQASTLPADQLSLLLEEADEAKAILKAQDDRLHAALVLRYGPKATEARRIEGKDTGRVRVPDGDFVVLADLPKRIDWNQTALRTAMDTIRSWGEDPADYITVQMEVSETKLGAWPSAIRTAFDPARTVRVGKPTFVIEAKREAA
jgi:hypothetical protein